MTIIFKKKIKIKLFVYNFEQKIIKNSILFSFKNIKDLFKLQIKLKDVKLYFKSIYLLI